MNNEQKKKTEDIINFIKENNNKVFKNLAHSLNNENKVFKFLINSQELVLYLKILKVKLKLGY